MKRGTTYVSIETVVQGSSEEPIKFKCRSEKEAMKLRSTLLAAPEMLEMLDRIRADIADQMDENDDEFLAELDALIAKAGGES